jgi:2-iminobutanoate/2-iminopropanoate deaminase
MLRHEIFVGCATAALLLAAVGFASQRRTSSSRVVNPSGVAINPNLSNGILVGDTLYVAGMQGTDASGKLVAGGIGPQTRAALGNVEAVLRAAGFTIHDVVSVNVYLADVSDYQAMNKVYDSVFPNPRPTRTTIQAGAIVGGARLEVSAIAVKK